MLIIGFVAGIDLNDNFLQLYMAKMGQIPARYSIIFVILFIDYFIFEDMNHYIYIFRYKSVSNFIIKSIINELIVSRFLLIAFHLPVFFFNIEEFISYIVIMLLVILNITVVISVILSVIRLINIWINNRILSTSLFMLLFIGIDILLSHYSFFYLETYIFEFDSLLVLPYVYSFYPLIISAMITIDLILLYVTSKLMKERDYIIKQHETYE